MRYTKNTDSSCMLFETKRIEDEFIISSVDFKTMRASVYKDAL